MIFKQVQIYCTLLLSMVLLQVSAQEFDGYALYNEMNSNTSYLIDSEGDIAHSWALNHPCNYAVLLMESGNIMRGATAQNNQINGAAVGGLVQEIDPDGNVVWEFPYSSSSYVSHHDITLMPNGGVLLTAWEVKSASELQALGYTSTSGKYPTHFVEVQHDGNGGGQIVWEWHMIDHFIQDTNPSLSNYGVISEHPELMDINVAISGGGGPGGGPGGGGGDWFHVNGVFYDAEYDQVAFSSRFLSEVFIIDHSTTIEEAASHSGGNSGKGGDFLYRWGKPSNYGIDSPQTIAGAVHDARIITNDGRPRGGYLQFFNNVGGTGGDSVVDAIELPRAADGYNFEYTNGESYGPTAATWRHECVDNADGQSASNSMPNGNVFVNLSREYMYEADADGNVIWQYASESPKAFRYTCDHAGVQNLLAQGVLEEAQCMLTNIAKLETSTINISPNPSTGIFQITGLDATIQQMTIYDILGRPIQQFSHIPTEIDLSANTAGVYFIKIELNNHQFITKKISLVQ